MEQRQRFRLAQQLLMMMNCSACCSNKEGTCSSAACLVHTRYKYHTFILIPTYRSFATMRHPSSLLPATASPKRLQQIHRKHKQGYSHEWQCPNHATRKATKHAGTTLRSSALRKCPSREAGSSGSSSRIHKHNSAQPVDPISYSALLR